MAKATHAKVLAHPLCKKMEVLDGFIFVTFPYRVVGIPGIKVAVNDEEPYTKIINKLNQYWRQT